MIPHAFEVATLSPQLVFDPLDVYAQARAVAGPHPRPVGPLRFRLLGEVVAGQRQDYEAPVRLSMTTNAGGYAVFLGLVEGPDGSRRRLRLGDGTYVVGVESGAYQAVEREDVVVPQGWPVPGPYLVPLEPGFAYPFPSASTLGAGRGPTLLRGSLESVDGSGIAGAQVLVPGASSTYRTGADGQWVVVFQDTQPVGPVTVRFRLPQGGGGFQDVDVAGVAVEPGASRSYRQPTLTGRVTTQTGAPVAGARVRVAGRPGAATSSTAGAWRYVFPVDFPVPPATQVDIEARHPDGTTQVRPNVPLSFGTATAVPPFVF